MKKRKKEKNLTKLGLLQARNHGNEPSKGAKIDAEIKAEEDELLMKKGAR